jgi:hypothetical protein
VVSILLAFGIQAWWEARQDSIDARESLQLLSRDLSETIDQLEEFAGLMALQTEAAFSAHRAMSRASASLDEEAVSGAINRVSARRTVRLSSAAYTEMLSSGGLRLIEDRTLRDRIVRFYEAARRSEEIITANNANFVDGLVVTEILGQGLVMPQANRGTNVGNYDEIAQRFEEALGDDYEDPRDPLWQLPDDSPEWNQVRAILLHAAKAAISNGIQARQIIDEASALRSSVDAALGR